jgi:hypothetical protein
MKILSLAPALLVSVSSLSAFAQPACEAYSTTNGRWIGSGPHQGLWAASITNGKTNEIYFSCDHANGMGSTMTLCLNGMRPTEPVVYMQIDEGRRDEVQLNYLYPDYFELRGGLAIPTDHVFENIVEALRQGKQVRFDDGKGRLSQLFVAKRCFECVSPFLMQLRAVPLGRSDRVRMSRDQ